MRYKQYGFSLIELMFALLIISILIAIVIPNYNNYVVQTRRSDGVAMLLGVMQQQERYFTERLTYTGDLTQLGFVANPLSEYSHYQISASNCATETLQTCVLLIATPRGVQSGDSIITLNSRGVRTPAAFWN